MNNKFLTFFLTFSLLISGCVVGLGLVCENTDGLGINDTFTADTSDDIPVTVTYKIRSLNPATVQVGNGSTCAIAVATSGVFTLPSIVVYDGVTYSVTSTAGNSFLNCVSLTSVVLPSSLISVGSSFQGCSSLTSVTIPSSVTSIGAHAFRSTALTSVTIPSSVMSIGDFAFFGCSSLTSVTIPSSVTSIGASSFSSCSSLTSVTVDNYQSSVTVGTDAFPTTATVTYLPEPVTYTLSFDVAGGSVVDSQTITSGSAGVEPVIPTKEGFTFDGWYQSDLTTSFDFSTVLTADTVAYAVWSAVVVPDPVTYTLSFDVAGGSVVDSQTITSGSAGVVPTSPTKDGYTFVGWYQSDLTTSFDFSTVLTADTVAYAVWSAVEVPAVVDPDFSVDSIDYVYIFALFGIAVLIICLVAIRSDKR